MKVVILKYNAGNIRSVLFALKRIGIDALVSDDPETILSADKVIFPGVGEASSAMLYLKENKLDELILSLKQPVLGICLGMQLMCSYSAENDTECLSIFPQKIKRFSDSSLKIPQIGWNTVSNLKSAIFENIPEKAYMYFVHGFYAELSEFTIAKTNYGSDYSSALQKDNFFALQFHPEKSGELGQKIIENFIYNISF